MLCLKETSIHKTLAKKNKYDVPPNSSIMSGLWWLMITVMIEKGTLFWELGRLTFVCASNQHSPPYWLSIKMFYCWSHSEAFVCVCVCKWERSFCSWSARHVWHLQLSSIPGLESIPPSKTRRRQHSSCVVDMDDKPPIHSHSDSYILIKELSSNALLRVKGDKTATAGKWEHAMIHPCMHTSQLGSSMDARKIRTRDAEEGLIQG